MSDAEVKVLIEELGERGFVQAPMSVVDYVVAHELVHLVHPHHGEKFWAALGRVMPEYEERRRALVERGGPGGSQELRISCLVVDPAQEKAKPKKKPPVPDPKVCRPECRDGYDCAYGECYPACNPPCAESEVCTGHGTAATCGAK